MPRFRAVQARRAARRLLAEPTSRRGKEGSVSRLSPGGRRRGTLPLGSRFTAERRTTAVAGPRGRDHGAARAGRGAGAEPGWRDARALPAGRLSPGTGAGAGAAGAGCRGCGGGSSEASSASRRRAALLKADA